MNSPSHKISVSIVIPVYCGAQTIGRLVETLIEALSDPYSLEIVLVNDCSPDNSEEVCIEAHKKYRSIVKCYSLAKNVGEHNAVMAGLQKSTGDWIVIMDDDFQNPVGEVMKLVSFAVGSPFDVVYTNYDKKKHSWFRNVGSKFNDKIANVILRKPKDLYLSSFKALNRFMVNEILKYNLLYPYIDGLILNTTSNIGTFRVEHREREHGKSGYTLKKLFVLWLNMFTNFSIFPLRIATGIGFLFAAGGFIAGIAAVIEKIMNPQLPAGYAFLVFIITLLAGIQLIIIGLVGEYLGRMLLYQNKKPHYSIRKAFENTD